jgi:hypothetical protein
MVNRKVKEIFVNKNNVLEIIDQTLAIQEKHCSRQKVPVISFNSEDLHTNSEP